MRTRTVRDTEITLPSDDTAVLDPVTAVPRPGERVSDRLLAGGAWARATIADTMISHCWLTDADLNATTLTNVTIERCVITGSTLQGAHWDTVTLKDVVFEKCRFDYATLTNLTTRGPVAFLGSSFIETTFADCTMTRAVFDTCRLGGLELERCTLRGADLRGNDLAGLAAATVLHGVTLSADQLPALTQRIVHELDITVTADR